LTNHKNGEKAVKEALGENFAYVDWIRPGFELSKQASFLKDAEGIILAHHGLIVWSDDSDECKQKNLDVINKVEKYLGSLSKRPESIFQHTDYSDEEYKNLLLQIRGRLNKKGKKILSLDTRLKEISSRKDVEEILSAGVSSADHMLRIKPWSAVLTQPKDKDKSIKSIDDYAKKYESYFEANKNLLTPGYSIHDSDPRVVLVPDLGAITTGHSLTECKMYADISFHTHKVASMAKDSFGNVEGLPDAEIFGFDYWPMELYKLASKPAPKKFAGNIFVVTGAASGIGLGISLELAKQGASLVLADLDENALNSVADKIKDIKGLKPELISGDQSDEKVVNKTVDQAIKTYGGLDGVVFSAGIAVTDQLKDLTIDKWNKGLAVNLTSAFLMTKAAMNAMRTQNSGGSLVYIASKNAFAPGAGFGGYSVSKAGMLQLMRIAALEGGANQIRANAINPDAIFDNSKLWEGGIREERAKAHGVKPDELEDFYAQRNILKSHVTSKDVANTTAFLLSDESARTTGSVIAVDGGVAAAFPR
jgi:NAD(P)-dependent dehydrogenase (short-subunit alcohol dehydrogenase family)